MLFSVYDPYDPSRPCVATANPVFVFFKATLNICRYAGIERTVPALDQIHEIHALSVTHFARICMVRFCVWQTIKEGEDSKGGRILQPDRY